MPMQTIDLGLTAYDKAYSLQKQILDNKKSGKDNQSYLVLAEFYDIITLGRSSDKNNLNISKDVLNQNNIEIKKISRGGDITYHGPGQLVIYPIIDLKNIFKDIHKYIRLLEEIIIKVLAEYNVCGTRKKNFTGVWVANKKIASIGIGVSKWITYHGIGFNINTDLSKFDMIVPCGIKDVKMTSLEEILAKKIDINEVKEKIVNLFQKNI